MPSNFTIGGVEPGSTPQQINLTQAAFNIGAVIGLMGLRRFAALRAFHRSRWVCKASQYPWVVPKASDNLKSMSADTAAWSLITRDNITRLMPMCCAKAVFVRARSSIHPESNSPGDAGLCMFIFCLSVVIQIVQQLNVMPNETEGQPPVGLHSDRQVPIQVT